jgi:hypothetical protein
MRELQDCWLQKGGREGVIGSDKPSAKQIMELLCTLANAAYYRDRECLRAQARKSILFFACERVSMPDSPVC